MFALRTSLLAAATLALAATLTPHATAATVQEDVIALTNAERAKAGCPALRSNAALNTAAQRHSADMATNNFMSHTGSDGSTVVTRIERAGYTRWTRAAENVAAGHSTAADVVRGWMNSSGHRANILNCALRDIGVGHQYRPGTRYGHYWTQNFGTR
ncbi:CAP domain-containing protein [Lentzea sp. NEAU-D7]|uniref:CAP domain-containing protein n=1 Tax=Lentzea sp. NEAU-D7 TaxID=2994667 RepID=UPI00224B9C98|nr:CAP domain-containing protein [Lentzea sp. NEAU-D7]MCX2949366.1 CAP domain-containing protein [Lentzea sp. NEAU-D7]